MRAPKITDERARTLRRTLTLPEVLLWQALRKRQLDGRLFRRQHPIGPYVLDFYCPSRHLAVEVDGASHDTAEQAAHDERRTRWLAGRGVQVVRVVARDVLSPERRLGVLATIAAAAAEVSAVTTSSTTLAERARPGVVPLLRDAEEDRREPDA